MNIKSKIFFKNLSHTFTANIISLLISTIIILIVPKLIGIEDYGYWQLYLFYASYVGFLQFGWNDGIYLKYGGYEYKKLDKQLFNSQFWILTLSQVLLAIFMIVLSELLVQEEERVFIFDMVAICTIIVGTRTMLLFLLQATNRIKEYAQVTIVDKTIYGFLIIGFLFLDIKEFKLLIVFDLIGKLVSLSFAMYFCKDIVFKKMGNFYFSFKETTENINIGIKLMFANIASMLIIGTVRFGIERNWNVETFGKVSLALSISSLMLLFINAIGIVIFPILKRTNKCELPSIYLTIKNFLMPLLMAILMLYYPISIILSLWLPTYLDNLKYMLLLFPLVVFEGKVALLINTYLKTLRKEKLMLKINVTSFVLSLFFTYITTVVIENLNLAVFSIVVLVAIRCIIAEIILAKILNIPLLKNIFLELIVTSTFVSTGWFLDLKYAFIFYLITYLFFLLIKLKDIKVSSKNINKLLKS